MISSENDEIIFFSQSTSSDKDHHKDLEQQQQPTLPIEPEITPKKSQLINSSDTAIVKENNTEETHPNRKATYESVIAQRKSPPLTHGIERVSLFISISLDSHCLFIYLLLGFHSSIKGCQSKSHQ